MGHLCCGFVTTAYIKWSMRQTSFVNNQDKIYPGSSVLAAFAGSGGGLAIQELSVHSTAEIITLLNF